MLRLLFTRRWLTALAAAAVFGFVAYHLGWWQYHKYERKLARNEVIDAHWTMPPVSLASVLPGGETLTDAQAYTRVTETGRYADRPQLLVRNRQKGSATGFEVLAPFRMSDGRYLVVDRGWVAAPNAAATALPDVPAAPTGTVTVTGWLAAGETAKHQRLPAGQLASVDLTQASGQWGGIRVVGAYLQLETETLTDGSSPPRPLPLDSPDTDLGVNQAYAYQWWLFIVCGFGLVYLGLRRDYRELHPEVAAAKPKKVRIWDEEDE